MGKSLKFISKFILKNIDENNYAIISIVYGVVCGFLLGFAMSFFDGDIKYYTKYFISMPLDTANHFKLYIVYIIIFITCFVRRRKKSDSNFVEFKRYFKSNCKDIMIAFAIYYAISLISGALTMFLFILGLK